MGTVIPQTRFEVLEPGMYRAKVGAVAVEDGTYGQQVALRFDLLDEGVDGRSITDRFVKAWATAKLSGNTPLSTAARARWMRWWRSLSVRRPVRS